MVKKCEPGDVFGWPPSRFCCTQFRQLACDVGREAMSSGELALLYNCPRAASVDAKARKVCAVLTEYSEAPFPMTGFLLFRKTACFGSSTVTPSTTSSLSGIASATALTNFAV